MVWIRLIAWLMIGGLVGGVAVATDVYARSAQRSVEARPAAHPHARHRTSVRHAAHLARARVTALLSGIASIYSGRRSDGGGRTASGERVRGVGLTAAHRTLPFGTLVRVTNRRNGHSVVVRINDRGPFVRGRVIDVTPAAARELGFSGITAVSLAVVGANEARR